MTEDEIKAIQGHVEALSIVVTQLVLMIPPEIAQIAIVEIRSEQDEYNKGSDSNESAADTARNSVLDGYLQLLQSVSSHG